MASDGYDIVYDPEVESDLKALDGSMKRRVMDAVDRRLSAQPEKYGKPLGGRFAGLRRVRVGDHRIVYQVAGRRVRIVSAKARDYRTRKTWPVWAPSTLLA